ncbi:hypothetical protein ACF09J_13990 [Streptomyces sp. NPDC014889]|uniref:hypothetical protein n=1 Tax=Streptomyces sp. NPDC014889 TaxID=3364928 RepID=UPI0036FEC40F
MGTEITEPTSRSFRQPRLIGEQRAAVEALVTLTEMLGTLPGGYIKIHQPVLSTPATLAIQFDNPQAFEQWRAALGIETSAVALHATSDEHVWLSVESVFCGVPFEMTGFGVPLTAEQAKTAQCVHQVPAVAA